jgi:hypothetical protein
MWKILNGKMESKVVEKSHPEKPCPFAYSTFKDEHDWKCLESFVGPRSTWS